MVAGQKEPESPKIKTIAATNIKVSDLLFVICLNPFLLVFIFITLITYATLMLSHKNVQKQLNLAQKRVFSLILLTLTKVYGIFSQGGV